VKNFLKKIFRERIEYHSPMIMHTHNVSNTTQYLYKQCKDLLTENRIPLHKIRFVYEKSFIYDIDNNKINPKYKVILPIKKNHPTIEIGKPENTIEVFLGEYRTTDNYSMLKQITRKTKHGIVFFVDDNIEDVMWLTNLDDVFIFWE